MMTSLEAEVDSLQGRTMEDSAILEVSSMAAGGLVKQESRDVDFLSNYSTSVEGSVVASSSIGSFSTLPEQEISDFPVDARDLQVKVDNPQKHVETLETFITFRITTRTSRPEFEESEYIVRRRYNDFNGLHQKLVATYPMHIIPPMPAKHTFQAVLNRYSREFIMARMKLLHKFLNRVVNHPILSCDKNLYIFLTAKPAEFSIHRKTSNNVLVKMTNSLQNMASVCTMKQQDLNLNQVRDYCNALVDKLWKIAKISLEIEDEKGDYFLEQRRLHEIFTDWAPFEPELNPILTAIGKAIKKNYSDYQMGLDFDVSRDEIREYLAYIRVVSDTLDRRDAMQIEYELTVEDLTKKRQEKDQLLGAGTSSNNLPGWVGSLWKGESRDEKLEKVGQAIPRLGKKMELLQDRVECANENLRSDLERWNEEKRSDLKSMLIFMADQRILHYQHCMDAWEEVLAGLKFDDVRLENTLDAPLKIPA